MNSCVVILAISPSQYRILVVKNPLATASFTQLTRHYMPSATVASKKLTMFAILIACSSLIGIPSCVATDTQTTKPAVENLGGSEFSSNPTDRKLVVATTQAPMRPRKQDLRRQYTYTGITEAQGSFSEIKSFDSICGYVTSDIRKSLVVS